MLYMLMLYHSFSNSNSIILIILCFIALIVQRLHNLKLNLIWYTTFINKIMILTSQVQVYNQTNLSLGIACDPLLADASYDHLEKWCRCSRLITSSKYKLIIGSSNMLHQGLFIWRQLLTFKFSSFRTAHLFSQSVYICFSATIV